MPEHVLKEKMAETEDKICILGAGTSGIAVAKNFKQAGIPFDCLEREDNIGGNWYYGKHASSVYDSTHLISSKRLTEYTDFPMPEDYPEFPNRKLVWEYLRAYCNQFQLDQHIEFNTSVTKIEPDVTGWQVELADGSQRRYRGVVVANGHNWDPRWPEYPGKFTGEVIHSSEYKTPDVLQGKKVLVVGAGNSGCDLAVEASLHAERAIHSMRRGYHVLPKFFKGKPIDQCGEFVLRLRMPLWVRRLAAAMVVRWVLGPAEMSGLPRPDHKLFECHPIINSRLHYQVAHGDLFIRPDIAKLDGNTVQFTDGSREEVDLILYATGFRLSFPFLNREHLNWFDDRPNMFLNVFHPERDDLFFAGLIQPDSGQWGLVDYQAQLIAKYLQALDNNRPQSQWFRKLKQTKQVKLNHGVQYVNSPRHRLEVEHFSYRETMKKMIAKFA